MCTSVAGRSRRAFADCGGACLTGGVLRVSAAASALPHALQQPQVTYVAAAPQVRPVAQVHIIYTWACALPASALMLLLVPD